MGKSGKLKSYGLKRKDYAVAHRLGHLEVEERAAAINGILLSCKALRIRLQGDLFVPGVVRENPHNDDEGIADGDGESDDAYAELAGADSAQARKGHRYPKSKFAGAATGDVLVGTFGDGGGADAAE